MGVEGADSDGWLSSTVVSVGRGWIRVCRRDRPRSVTRDDLTLWAASRRRFRCAVCWMCALMARWSERGRRPPDVESTNKNSVLWSAAAGARPPARSSFRYFVAAGKDGPSLSPPSFSRQIWRLRQVRQHDPLQGVRTCLVRRGGACAEESNPPTIIATRRPSSRRPLRLTTMGKRLSA